MSKQGFGSPACPDSTRASVPGCRATNAPDVRVGDRLIFGKFAGPETAFEGEEFLILREDAVFRVVESTAEERKAG